MMIEETYPTLNDVLIEFIAEFEQPTREAIELLIRQYPHYEREIVDFSAVWIEQEILPSSADVSSEEAQLLVDRAMSHAQNILFSQEQMTVSNTTEVSPIKSLVSEAKECSIGVKQLMQDCDLDKYLLTKLDRRMIIPDTIPKKLINKFSLLLHRTVEVIFDYFRKPTSFLEHRSFLAREKPQIPSRQDFAEAVRQSSLPDEKKSQWLAEVADLREKD